MQNAQNGQKGAALIGTLFFLVITTAIAAGALMLSTVQVKVAGSVAHWEEAFSAADGGIYDSIAIIKYAHFDAKVPEQYCNRVLGDCGIPGVPDSLVTEMQRDLYSFDEDTGGVDIRFTAFRYSIEVDVDAIGTSISPGSGIEAAWAYHGSAYGSGFYRAYRVTSGAEATAGSSRARIEQVLWLRATM